MAIGVEAFAISSKTGFGLKNLEQYLQKGTTVVFLGSSGVGKSSLVNALAKEELMPVNSIREDDSKGRHTTTHRQLIMLKSGAMIIDTPGMRELGMWDVSNGISKSFADVEQFFEYCKFRDCNHKCEPGCGVTAAIKNGELSQERWDSYLKLKNEAKYSDDKSAYLRSKKEFFKSISKTNKNNKKR